MEENYKFKMGETGDNVYAVIRRYNEEHCGKVAVHVESKTFHKVEFFGVLISNDIAELSVTTHPLTNGSNIEISTLKHTRPCSEFFDGRFII